MGEIVMERICKNCYWYKPNSSYSSSINCLNDFEKVSETDTCKDFILEEDYVPTGIWADLAGVIEAVAQEVKEREREENQ
jgi:hypothetical protein